MKFGFGRTDITPRVGVELQGYGPFLNRHSDGVRDPLCARAMAAACGDRTAVLVSCDLVGVSRSIVATVRELVEAETGLTPEQVMVHAIHTHSGPALRMYSGWGTPDPAYLELLPRRIARACAQAVGDLQDGVLMHAETPCEGIAINREYDAFQAESVDAILADDWRPSKPDCTDTTCHVLKVMTGDVMRGFLSHYGCHPVIGGPNTRKIHGDFAGVATSLIEEAHPGSVGLFLQGAQGDINACVVCTEEKDAMIALDAVSRRYARAVECGLAAARPLEGNTLQWAVRRTDFTRANWGHGHIRKLLEQEESVLHAPDASDADPGVRMAMVRAGSLRAMLRRLDAGETSSPETELHGLRLGPVALLGAPFEIFRSIKNDVVEKARSPLPLVMGFVDDSIGYAADRTTAAKGGYAADTAPMICGQLPFANIHDELVRELLALDGELTA